MHSPSPQSGAVTAIDAVVARARRLNISMAALCERSGVEYSTLWRWRKGIVAEPHPARVTRATEALHATLDAIKREMEAA